MLYQNEIIIWTNEHWILTIPLDIFMCMLSSILPCLSVSSNPRASCLVLLSLEKVVIEVCDINQLMSCNWKSVVRRQFIRYRNRILITYFEDIRSSLCFLLGHYLNDSMSSGKILNCLSLDSFNTFDIYGSHVTKTTFQWSGCYIVALLQWYTKGLHACLWTLSESTMEGTFNWTMLSFLFFIPITKLFL